MTTEKIVYLKCAAHTKLTGWSKKKRQKERYL